MTVTQPGARAISSSSADELESFIHFPDGLIGCSNWKRFVLLSDTDEELPLAVLQCLDEANVALMVTDPALVSPGYTAPLSADDRKALGLSNGANPVLYCTLTIAKEGAITANLLGPLAINPRTGAGMQLVLADSAYSARHPVGSVEARTCSS